MGAYIASAQKLLAGGGEGEAYNFSNEVQVTVRQLVEIISRAAGVTHLEPIVLNDAPNEIAHQYLSAAKARRELAWTPRYTLEQGMVETVEWYRRYFADLKQQSARAVKETR